MVHCETQLAKSLTEPREVHQLTRDYSLDHKGKVVADPEMRPARVRRKKGLDALDGAGRVPQVQDPDVGGVQISHLTDGLRSGITYAP